METKNNNVQKAYALLNQFIGKHSKLNKEAVEELDAIIKLLESEMDGYKVESRIKVLK